MSDTPPARLLIGWEETFRGLSESSGLAAALAHTERISATFSEALRPAAEVAERALREATADLLTVPSVVLGEGWEQVRERCHQAIETRVHRLAAGTLEEYEEMPDTRHSATAYRATLTARHIARRALRAHLVARHPGGLEGQREAAAERHRALVRAAWNLYLSAALAALRGDDEAAGRHLQAVSETLEATQAAVSITTHRHHRHRPRRALAPPGRRCAALHLTAQAPPRGLPCHTSDMAPHGSARPPG